MKVCSVKIYKKQREIFNSTCEGRRRVSYTLLGIGMYPIRVWGFQKGAAVHSSLIGVRRRTYLRNIFDTTGVISRKPSGNSFSGI